MQTRGHGSQIIPYNLLYIATSIERKPPYSELWTPQSCPSGQNQYKFPSESGQSQLTSKELKNVELCLSTTPRAVYEATQDHIEVSTMGGVLYTESTPSIATTLSGCHTPRV